MTTIIFDWGGVIAPSDVRIAVKHLKKSFDFDENEFIQFYFENEDAGCHTDEYKDFLEEVSKKFNISVNEIIKGLDLAKPNEVFDIAKELSTKYEVYLLSNQLRFRTEFIKSNFDLSFFKQTFFSNEVKLKKPSEEIFLYTLKQIKKQANECLFVDDNIDNITTAKKLGINTIQFKNKEQLKKELKDFSIIIN